MPVPVMGENRALNSAGGRNGMLEEKKTKMRCFSRISISTLFAILLVFCLAQPVFATGKISVSYYYEEVCASCDGTKDFFELYNRVISAEDKKQFQAEIATYNVFMDSCKVRYEEVKKDLQIPSGTSLPVLIVGDTWISGHDNMEAQMREVLLSAEPEEEAPTEAIEKKEKDQ